MHVCEKHSPFVDRGDLTIGFELEAVWADFKINDSSDLILCCMYRLPDATCKYFDKILDMLDKVTVEGKEVALFGDFNIDYKIDESLSNNPIHQIESLYVPNQLVTKPTRVTNNSSKCIDLILSSIPEKHLLCDVAKVALSDHYMIYTCIGFNVKTPKHKTIKFKDYKDFNADSFMKDIGNDAVLKLCQVTFQRINICGITGETPFQKLVTNMLQLKKSGLKKDTALG